MNKLQTVHLYVIYNPGCILKIFSVAFIILQHTSVRLEFLA